MRRALAAAARAEDAETPATMPPAVAARLDGVLAELVQGRSATQAASPAPGRGPDELAAHRARRRLNVLVAAAARRGDRCRRRRRGDRRSRWRGRQQRRRRLGLERLAGQRPRGRPGVPAGGGGPLGAAGRRHGPPSPVARRARDCARARSAADVRRVVALGCRRATSPEDARKLAVRPDGSACDRPTVPRGADVVDVRLDGEPATLVVDRATGGTREARVYSCDDATAPVASTTVPAP